MVLREYWDKLSPQMKQVDYNNDFKNAQEEFDVLIDNWFGMLLLDMAKSSVEERKHLKEQEDLKRMMKWAEKTSARIMLMCAAKRFANKSLPKMKKSKSSSQ